MSMLKNYHRYRLILNPESSIKMTKDYIIGKYLILITE